jgi:hypothetical protein
MTLTDTTTAVTPATDEEHHNGHDPEHGKKPYKNRLEIWKPPTNDLEGYFDVTVEDPNGVAPSGIIKSSTPWRMRISTWLLGEIWKCVSGTLCYDVYFEEARTGTRTALSDLVGYDLETEFEGCRVFKDGSAHLELVVEIPAGKLPPGQPKPAVYDWTAVVAFRNPCGDFGVIAGHDKGHVQIYKH